MGADEMAEDMAFFGAHKLAKQYGQRPEEHYYVFPENVPTVKVFASQATQWAGIAGAMGGYYYQGLDYSKVRSTLELQQIPPSDWPEIFDGLQVMEAAAKNVFNKDK